MVIRLSALPVAALALGLFVPSAESVASGPAAPMPPSTSGPSTSGSSTSGTLPQGGHWAAEMPGHWNGTLLLWGRGYSARLGTPEVAPAPARQILLDRGYALAASDYGAAGWSLAEAVPAQKATIAAFQKAYGKPARVIGWGQSMGGLVTTALAEEKTPVLHGAIALCPSIGGAVGMMNMALDGAFAFQTLLAPDAGLQLTGVVDDRANSAKAQAAVDVAMGNPQGRARLGLAGVLAGIPAWTRKDHPRPAAQDYDSQLDEIGAAFVGGVFLPRVDQETRAGGAFSWNQGIDYRAQLQRSGRGDLVRALYAKAGLDLDADLARLAKAPRLAAKPSAVRYMMQHYTPTGRPAVPLLSVQAIGDGATSPSLQRAYGDVAPRAKYDALWLGQAGHCGFSADVLVAALRHLEQRLARGGWPKPAAGFVTHRPPPMLRPCFRRNIHGEIPECPW